MKKLIGTILLCGFILLFSTGCVGTIYSAAMDERNVKTVASDTSIEFSIMKKLADEKSSDLMDVSVSSYEGKVFLVGEYEDTSQKSRFIKAAKSVEGVKSVNSYLKKSDKNHKCGTSKNIEITAKVKTALIGDKSIWSTNVHVSTIKCQVVLWGTVGTYQEVSKSIKHANSVEGVSSVKSFLKSK